MTIKPFMMIGAAALLIAGCGGADSNESREKAMEDLAASQGIDADVTVNDDGETEKVVINAGAGQVGMNLDLPAGFPDDVKLPADWNIIGSSSPMPDMQNLQAMSEATTDEIVADLRSRLGDEGWTETGFEQPTPAMSQLGFEKGERIANFNIIENGETRMIQLATLPKP